MPSFVLDLSYVKCPMNLVLVKKAVYDGAFSSGGKIIIHEEIPRRNITNYLTLKGFDFKTVVDGIEIMPKIKT